MSIRKLLNWKTFFIYTHRWTGIVFGVIFVVWFISGVAMMYVGMPHLSEKERLGHLKPLDLSTVTVSPAQAAEMYRPLPCSSPCGNVLRRAARVPSGWSDDLRRYRRTDDRGKRGASDRFRAPLAPGARSDGALRRVSAGLRPVDALQRAARGDATAPCVGGRPRGNEVYYISEDTGEPTMKTDRRGRVWGYIGAVLHWTYFTSLRRNGPLWQQLVAWGAIAGAVMCVLGMVVGIVRLRVTRRYRLRSGPSLLAVRGLDEVAPLRRTDLRRRDHHLGLQRRHVPWPAVPQSP